MPRFNFPPGFLWGAATSSHQVEGNNRWSDWWEYEETGRLPHRSGDACRHYELYEQDFDLARSWGHNAHRFSIEWSRIEPAEGEWNPDAIGHYRAVIRALKERGLEPVLTLHHFTNPAWFTAGGGWLRRDSPKVFARYVNYIVENLGEEIKYWVTINEPTVYVWQGYIKGEWPPCLKASWVKSLRVLTNLAKAHVAAYRVLHTRRHDILVGFAHSARLLLPCDPERIRDRIGVNIRDIFWNRTFFNLIGVKQLNGKRPQCLDFIGLNYYTRSIIYSAGWGIKALLGRVCRDSHHADLGPISDMSWEVYPLGLEIVLERFSRFGIPLFITENGIATNDEKLRRTFLIEHLVSLANSLDRGITIIGYLYWALIDNYEWAMGTRPHFGLAAVDHNSGERRPRPCVEEFGRVCRGNRLHV